MNGRDEFHVGWAAASPPGLAAFTRRAVLLLAAGAVGIAALLAVSQGSLPDGLHEYGHLRTFEGSLRVDPFPVLVLERRVGEELGAPALLLVGAGKHGIPMAMKVLDGRNVRFRGTLIRREMAMAELTDPSSLTDLGPASLDAPRSFELGEVSLTGELVDTKCWLGVMRPASGKVHRACAVRCLSGGIPPGLLLRREDGTLLTVMLVDADGGRFSVDPLLAARALRVSGSLYVADGIATLRVRSWGVLDAS